MAATICAPDNVAAAQPLVAALTDIAAAHEVEPAAVALAWLLAKPGVVPLPGAKSGAQAARNGRALRHGSLAASRVAISGSSSCSRSAAA